MDQAHLETDKIIEKIAKRLNREYKTANKDMEKKLDKYLKAFDRKDRAKRDLLKQGLISEKEYKDWRVGQIMIGKRWEEMLDTLAQDYHNTNEIARQIAKDNAYDVYALNHDYGTFQVEKESLVDTSYTLYDRATVSRLAKEDQKMLPDPSERTLKRIRDAKEKRWSKQKLNSAIMQGILQGEPLSKVAKRLQSVTNMEKAQAMRNARTMMTNAQSAGRYDAYRRAKGMGIDFKVVWIATLDNRTRHEHRLLDGQMQDVDTPFEVDGQQIMYPADLGGSGYKVPPELIYNCRCTIGAAIPGTKLYEQGLQGIDRFSRLGDMSYEEWKNEHARIMDPETGELLVEPEKPKFVDVSATTTKLKGAMADKDYNDFINLVGQNPDVARCYTFADSGKGKVRKASRGCHYPGSNDIDIAYPKQVYINDGMSRYRTTAHEYGHFFDDIFGRDEKKFDIHSLTWNEVDTIEKNVNNYYTSWVSEHKLSNSDLFLTAMRQDIEKIKAEGGIVGYCLADKNTTISIQDAIDGFGLGTVMWGHGDRYYNQNYNQLKSDGGAKATTELQLVYKSLGFDASTKAKTKDIYRHYDTASELWANCMSADVCGGKELEHVKEKLPNTYNAYKQILKGVKDA